MNTSNSPTSGYFNQNEIFTYENLINNQLNELSELNESTQSEDKKNIPAALGILLKDSILEPSLPKELKDRLSKIKEVLDHPGRLC